MYIVDTFRKTVAPTSCMIGTKKGLLDIEHNFFCYILVMKISGLESGVKHQLQIKDNQISKLSCAYRVQMILYLVYLVQGILIEKTQPQF